MKCKNCVRHVHLNDDGERTIGTPNWCFYISDSPDEELERDCIAFKSLTNADRIRAMTDEQLTAYLGHASLCVTIQGEDAGAWCSQYGSCNECIHDWLRQEAPDET